MSFSNFDSFQNQDTSAGGPAAPQADVNMAGQPNDASPAPFQGAPSGDAATPGAGSAGGEGKTTLWYVAACESAILVHARTRNARCSGNPRRIIFVANDRVATSVCVSKKVSRVLDGYRRHMWRKMWY